MIDVLALVATGLSIAKGLIPDAFTPAVVRLAPNRVQDLVNDTDVVTWGQEIPVDIFGFDDEDQRKTQDPETLIRSFILDMNGVTSPVNEQAQVETDGIVWNIYKVDMVPGKPMAILHGRA